MNGLMKETEDVAQRRKEYREMKKLLHRALEIVNEVLICRRRSTVVYYTVFEHTISLLCRCGTSTRSTSE